MDKYISGVAILSTSLILTACGSSSSDNSTTDGNTKNNADKPSISVLTLAPTKADGSPLLRHTTATNGSTSIIRDINGKTDVIFNGYHLAQTAKCYHSAPNTAQDTKATNALVASSCKNWNVDLSQYGGSSLQLKIEAEWRDAQGAVKEVIASTKQVNIHKNSAPEYGAALIPESNAVTTLNLNDSILQGAKQRYQTYASDPDGDAIAQIATRIQLSPETGWQINGQQYQRANNASGKVTIQVRGTDQYDQAGEWRSVYQQTVNPSSSTPTTPVPTTPPTPAPTEPALPTTSLTKANITDVVLLTGQSNALGAHTQAGYNATLDAPNTKVWAYTSDGWKVASLWQDWYFTWPRGGQSAPSNNLLLHFGKQVVAQDSHRVVGFILTSAPGQAISHWDQGTGFYEEVKRKVETALGQLPQKTKLDGILWHQGETDYGDTNYYSQKLDQLISNFRNEYWFSADRPFICGETIAAPVNRRLMMLNTDGDANTGCVAAAGLPARDANIHFSTEGLRTLGTRYGTKYIQMTP